jgi:hypothetical protein
MAERSEAPPLPATVPAEGALVVVPEAGVVAAAIGAPKAVPVPERFAELGALPPSTSDGFASVVPAL